MRKKYFIDLKYSHFNEFEKCVLKNRIEEGKVVFLWDALDEINNDEEIEVITDFIKEQVSRNSSNHWITCRRHLQVSTERKFNVLSNIIGEFSDEEQRSYINDRLKNVYCEQEITEIKQQIQQHVAFIKFKEILSIPLQIFMLTEICLNDKKFVHSLKSGSFSIINVYENFVKQKFNIFYYKKIKIDSKVADLLKKQINAEIRSLQKVSLYSIFEKKILDKLKINLEELEEYENDPFGFITEHKKANETKFHFVHISYAEYFAACYFAKHRSEKSFLFEEKYTNIRFFFDMILAQESPAHQAVLCKNLQALKKCEKTELLKADLGGRSILQVASSWSERHQLLHFIPKDNNSFVLKDHYKTINSNLDFEFMQIIEYLLDNNLHSNTNDDCFKMNDFEYAKISNCWFVITLIDYKEKALYFQDKRDAALSILVYVALNGWAKIDFILEQLECVTNIQTESGETLLYLASEYEYDIIVLSLLRSI